MEINQILNNPKDSSTKIKLKLDNSKVKIEETFQSDKTSATVRTEPGGSVSPRITGLKIRTKNPDTISKIPFYQTDFYVHNALYYNKRIKKMRNNASKYSSQDP